MSHRGQIPSSWIECTLGDVIEYGSTQKAEPWEIPDDAWLLELEDIEKNTSRILRTTSFAERRSKSTKNRFEAGDVLYGKLRPYLNKVVRANRPGFCTTEIVPIRPSEHLDGGYLFHWLKHPRFLEYVTATSHGLNMPRLGTEAGNRAPFVLAPINEQEDIARKLDALLARADACRDRLDHLPNLLRRLRQSVLAAGTSGQLTDEWREARRLSGAAGMQWEPVTLGELCQSSFYGPRFGKSEYTRAPGSVPTIRTTDMTDDGRIVVTEDTPRVLIPPARLDQFRVRPGDLLITRTGSIGVMAVFEDDYLAVPSAYLIRFRFDSRVLPRYVFLCLTAPEGQRRLGLSATAVTQPNVNAEAIRRIEFQLPPLDEQGEIVRRVDAICAYANRLEARYATARAKLDGLTPALLAQGFRGELVPQDPSDEPASLLLGRIRAARTASQSAAGRHRQKMGLPPELSQKAEALMLNRKDVPARHLTAILRERGPLTAEALWLASQLDIDEFYDQIKEEEARGLLKEKHGDSSGAPRLLEATG